MRRFIRATIVVSLFAFVSPAFSAITGTGTGDREVAPEPMTTPPLGVKPALRQGLFADLQVGGFFTINLDYEQIGRQVSNAQPYVGVGLGYDVTRNIVAGMGLAYGASAGACFDPDRPTGTCNGARSFSVMLINAHVGYLHGFDHQWYLGAKVLGGAALMTPGPEGGGADLLFGYNGGLALATEYHTHLEHFVLGLDVAATFVMGGRQVRFPGIAIYPRLKYVF